MKAALALVPLFAGCVESSEPAFDLSTCGEAETFRITGATLARTADEARALGRDLDADASIDNQLGLVFSTVAGQLPELDLERTAAANLATTTAWRLAVRHCADGDVAVALGDAAKPADVYAIGPSIDGRIDARGTGVQVPVSALSDGLGGYPDPGYRRVVRALIALPDPSDPGVLDEVTINLAVALEHAATVPAVVAPMTPFLDRYLTGSERDAFDDNGDGQIVYDEVEQNDLVVSLLSPDLELDGVRALSYGIALTAVRE